jgi:hypothetical protein
MIGIESAGAVRGHDLENWFRAESELMRRAPIEIKEHTAAKTP